MYKGRELDDRSVHATNRRHSTTDPGFEPEAGELCSCSTKLNAESPNRRTIAKPAGQGGKARPLVPRTIGFIAAAPS